MVAIIGSLPEGCNSSRPSKEIISVLNFLVEGSNGNDLRVSCIKRGQYCGQLHPCCEGLKCVYHYLTEGVCIEDGIY